MAESGVQLDAPFAKARRDERQHALHAEGAPREGLDGVGRALGAHQRRAQPIGEPGAVEHLPVKVLVLHARAQAFAHAPEQVADGLGGRVVLDARVAPHEDLKRARHRAEVRLHAQAERAQPFGCEALCIGCHEDRREALAQSGLVLAERGEQLTSLYGALLVRRERQLQLVLLQQCEQLRLDLRPQRWIARRGLLAEQVKLLLEIRRRIKGVGHDLFAGPKNSSRASAGGVGGEVRHRHEQASAAPSITAHQHWPNSTTPRQV